MLNTQLKAHHFSLGVAASSEVLKVLNTESVEYCHHYGWLAETLAAYSDCENASLSWHTFFLRLEVKHAASVK
jgi:hypothetical protein